jgi:hypothetical protein
MSGRFVCRSYRAPKERSRRMRSWGLGKLPVAGFEFAENPLTYEALDLLEEQATVAFTGETQGALELGLSSRVARGAGEVAEDGAGSH